MELLPADSYGYGFVPEEYLPPGKDEYWLRNLQAAALCQVGNSAVPGGGVSGNAWRSLRAEEIAALEQNGCRSGCWDHVLVTDPFDPALVCGTSFYGLVRIGPLENKLLRHHDFTVPVGIRNSVIVSCDLGADVSIQDCALLSHYIIGSRSILSRIDEMVCSNHAKFGSGIVKDGEAEEVRIWIDVMNEAGGRSILPFAGMIPADAYLWAAYRDDTALVEQLKCITQNTVLPEGIAPAADGEARQGRNVRPGLRPGCRGFYGVIGTGAVIKSCRIIKDMAAGPFAYIKGANKLKNITVLSSEEEPAQIGEGVELVNGIIGYGSHVFYGSKAVRFVLGNRCNLKYGARLIHSVLGDNSTVSCCEILNNLVFPVHEQHHNNSFLIAGLVGGMSNMAAGATVGSNHNSRANDGEIRAGRGFWPGLSVTLKHSSRFASFCLIVKGDYPYELNIPFPFALVNNNVRRDRLEVMPAYFWIYNLYALERNSWKTADRDRRRRKVQRIEADYLAPDTAEEIITALAMMEQWMAGTDVSAGAELSVGAELSADASAETEADPEYDYSAPEEEILPASGLERHSRQTVILKPRRAAAAYREMLFFYGMKTVIAWLDNHPGRDFAAFCAEMTDTEQSGADRVREWVNMGGQIIPAFRVDELRRDIGKGKIADWEAIHRRYEEAAAAYGEDRLRHAWAILALLGPRAGAPANMPPHPLADKAAFKAAADEALRLSAWIKDQVFTSRAKDFHDPFRGITYRNRAEMEAVAGKAENNPFVLKAEEKHKQFAETVKRVVMRVCCE